ncbi:MAG TPA: zinc ribbon domain-containing protein [Anaerolineaceae bacterium]
MDLGAIFFLLGVVILVGLFVARPLIAGKKYEVSQGQSNAPLDHRRSALLAERDRVIKALAELDFDQAMGKIPSHIYPVQRAELVQRGAQVLRDLDEMTAQHPDLAAEDRIEAAIAARKAIRHDQAPRTVPMDEKQPADDVEKRIAARRQELKEKVTGFCPKCGKPIHKSDRFCSSCGATLIAEKSQ